MPKRIIKLGVIRPSYAIALEYQKRLRKLILAMNKDVLNTIESEYSKQQNKIIFDSQPVEQMRLTISRLLKKWEWIFKSKAGIFASDFIDEIDKHNKLQQKRSVAKLDDDLVKKLTINFSKESKQAVMINKSLIQRQIDLITKIPNEQINTVKQIVFEGIDRGRDKSFIVKELQHINGISDRRAKLIAHNQLNYSTGIINRQRQKDLGFDKSMWKHSSASKEPRVSHLHANNKIFENDKGCLIDGEYILPGEKIGCNCYSVVVVEF